MKILEEKLNNVRSMLAQMAVESQSMLKDSASAILNINMELAKDVKQRDSIVDKLDNDIEETCFKILAMYDPKAFDLRFIISSLRITVDLERIGDSCVNIAKQVKHINGIPAKNFSEDIKDMVFAAYNMVSDSINAFFNNDIESALVTIKKDDYIDKLNKRIIKEIINFITHNPQKVQDGVALIYVARNIERIADHATNICELVYFKKTGKSIRHTYFDSAKEVLGNGKNPSD